MVEDWASDPAEGLKRRLHAVPRPVRLPRRHRERLDVHRQRLKRAFSGFWGHHLTALRRTALCVSDAHTAEAQGPRSAHAPMSRRAQASHTCQLQSLKRLGQPLRVAGDRSLDLEAWLFVSGPGSGRGASFQRARGVLPCGWWLFLRFLGILAPCHS